MLEQKLKYYKLKPAIIAPLVVIGVSVYFIFTRSPWYSLSIPLAILASFPAAPNFNLADGCLVYIVMIVGFALMSFGISAGEAILLGTAGGYYLSAVEKLFTKIPVYDET